MAKHDPYVHINNVSIRTDIFGGLYLKHAETDEELYSNLITKLNFYVDSGTIKLKDSPFKFSAKGTTIVLSSGDCLCLPSKQCGVYDGGAFGNNECYLVSGKIAMDYSNLPKFECRINKKGRLLIESVWE